jgi:putative nucleotidyltransferase with HDIG domain
VTQKQLDEIKSFAKGFYSKTGAYHDWSHVRAVLKHALKIAEEFKEVDRQVLKAVCYLHDIGRAVKDEGHPAESVRLARPFLKRIGLKREEIGMIEDAVANHTAPEVHQAKTQEAKILFDADKLEILSVAGFLRTLFFLVEERKMDLAEAFGFLGRYASGVWRKHLQTKEARKALGSEMKILTQMADAFDNWRREFWEGEA